MSNNNKKIKYKKPSGRKGTYSIYENDKTKVSYDANEVIWAERYRPRIIEDLILPKYIFESVIQYIKDQTIPNLLLYSAEGGLGKDSVIQVLYNAIPMEMMTINASLHRDINTIRTDVIEFVSHRSMEGSRKVVYLNEVGGLTKIALDSLKGIIEDYSKNASFIMTTNLMDNITHPLQSRFDFFDMNLIPKSEKNVMARGIYNRVCAILENEEVEYDAKAIQMLLKDYFPRYREIIINLKKAIKDGRLSLEVVGADEAIGLYKETLKFINDKDFVSLVKLSEQIEVPHFLSWIRKDILLRVDSLDKLSDFVLALDELQTQLNNRVPFANIPFLVFCSTMIDEGVVFRIS